MPIHEIEEKASRQGTTPAIGIELRGGSLIYRGRPVFEGLDLDIAAGRTTCLLGPSGVGKSSLLRLIAGILPEAGAQRLAMALQQTGEVEDAVAALENARLKAPAKIGQELRVESWLEDRSGREITIKSQLRAPDGSLIAQGTASLVALDQKQIERLGVV